MAETDGRDLERLVKISAPYDSSVEAEVKVESLPVWFDLGWQKVDGEDYGTYADLTPAEVSTSAAYEYRQAPNPSTPQANPRTVNALGGSGTPEQP